MLGSSLSGSKTLDEGRGIPPLPLALDEGRGPAALDEGPAALDEGPAEESGEPCGLSCGELSNPSIMLRAEFTPSFQGVSFYFGSKHRFNLLFNSFSFFFGEHLLMFYNTLLII